MNPDVDDISPQRIIDSRIAGFQSSWTYQMSDSSRISVSPSWRRWRLLVGRFRRIVRWEYWPTLPLYFPVIPVVLWQGIRYRSLGVISAVNPGIPSGGFVMHSKSHMLRALEPSGLVATFETIPGWLYPAQKIVMLGEWLAKGRFEFPLVLKPDHGERGIGVSIVRTRRECVKYLSLARETTIVQTYIPGVEYGVFYERVPGEEKGRITGITHKATTRVTGDGRSTLERLILADKRAVCQAEVFLELQKDRLDEIIPEGETVALNLIGTHSRGSLFLDACDERTEEMEAAVDAASRVFEGFHFGRFDIRCPSLEALKRGEDFHIVELNGVTSEPTHIYDPRHSVFYAWWKLAAQWARAYRIAGINRSLGHPPMGTAELFRRILVSKGKSAKPAPVAKAEKHSAEHPWNHGIQNLRSAGNPVGQEHQRVDENPSDHSRPQPAPRDF